MEAQGNFKFTREAADEFEQVGLEYLVLLNSLHTHYVNHDHVALFDVTGKCHYLAHCIIGARYLNPQCSWCYAGEDILVRRKRYIEKAICSIVKRVSEMIPVFSDFISVSCESILRKSLLLCVPSEKDLMQKSKNLMSACVKGSSPAQSMQRFMQQYRCALSYQFNA